MPRRNVPRQQGDSKHGPQPACRGSARIPAVAPQPRSGQQRAHQRPAKAPQGDNNNKTKKKKPTLHGGGSIQRNVVNPIQNTKFEVYIGEHPKTVTIQVSGNLVKALYNIGTDVYGLKHGGAFNFSKVYYKLPDFAFKDQQLKYTGKELNAGVINVSNSIEVKEKIVLDELNNNENASDAKGAVVNAVTDQFCTIS